MRQVWNVLLLFLFYGTTVAQVDTILNDELKLNKNTQPKGNAKVKSAPVDLYKIVTLDNDTTYVDTTLTVQNEYKHNYLRKDSFGLLPFLNEGQTYTALQFDATQSGSFPQFGFRAKHFAYLETHDIRYYNVPTPYTDLYFRSVMEQGQNVDAFLTLNTSENLNFSIAYKGLRSLGKYQNQLTSTGNFRFTSNYNSPNKRYQLKMHLTAQDFFNQENGGIVDLSQFEGNENVYSERSRVEVFFYDAHSQLKGNRLFFDHAFRLNKAQNNGLVLQHRFTYENKFFEFEQPTASDRFGDRFSSYIKNKTRYNTFYNRVGVAFSTGNLGNFLVFVEDYNYNYYYNRTLTLANGAVIPNSINDRINTWGVQYNYQKNNWKAGLLFSNALTSQSLAHIQAHLRWKINGKNSFAVYYQNLNKLPNLNFVLYQSDYLAYNWSANFKNEKSNSLKVEANTQWLAASVQYSVLNDHLYFANTNPVYTSQGIAEQLLVKPKQFNQTISHLSVKVAKDFKFWKLGLDNTLLYQKVDQAAAVLNVPQFVTRNTFYFSDYFFKKALFMQTGITLNYFSKYYANDYNPLLGDFYIQEQKKVGNFPMLDFFVNAKIRTFRVYLKAEQFNSSFTGNNFYTAPNYPYRDFIIRFGVTWNFFS